MPVCSKSQRMVAFTAAAVDGPDYFSRQCELDGDLQAAIQWVSSRTQEEACPLFHAHNIVCSNANWQVNSVRLQTIAQIEKAGQQMRLSGAVDKWFGGSDSKVKQICKGVNGPLLQMLAEQAVQPQKLRRPSKTESQKTQLVRLPGRANRKGR